MSDFTQELPTWTSLARSDFYSMLLAFIRSLNNKMAHGFIFVPSVKLLLTVTS